LKCHNAREMKVFDDIVLIVEKTPSF